MTLRLDSRQSRQRAALDQLSNSTDLRLDVILNLINDELTMPLRMKADSTPSRNLNIGDIEIQTIDGLNGTGRKKTIQPISNLIPAFTAGYLSFASNGPSPAAGTIQTITASGFTLASTYILPTSTAGYYIKVMMALSSTGQVALTWGSPAVSEAAATLPVALSGTLALGYVTITYSASNVINTVVNTNIHQFSGGGGGGGSGASAKQVTQSSHGFSVGQVVYLNSSTYALARADSQTTAEAIGVVSNVVTANIFEVTELGYVSGLSGLTAGTVYFLSEATAGVLTAAEPSVLGQISKPMFIADSATSGYVLNYRGVVVGGTNARTQLNLSSNATTQIFNAASPQLYTAGELTGWVQLGTSQKFLFKAPFAQNGPGTDWNISPSYVGDTPPAGFSITMSSAGAINAVCPTFSGTGLINYALNAPAVGATFPLAVDGTQITGGLVPVANLPAATATTAGTIPIYRTGTWTPIITTAGTNFASVTYGLRFGIYTQIGNLMTVTFVLQWTNTTGSPTLGLRIDGLPSSPAANVYSSSQGENSNIVTPGASTPQVVLSLVGVASTQLAVNAVGAGVSSVNCLASSNSGAASRYIAGFLSYQV